jgi:hypothetical protein
MEDESGGTMDQHSTITQPPLTAWSENHLEFTKWTDGLEELMQRWGEKAAGNRELHRLAANYWKRVANVLYVPVLLCTTIGGVSTFGIAQEDSINPLTVYTIASLNLTAAFLTSIIKFYNPEERAFQHMEFVRKFASFNRKITLQLNFPRKDRMTAKELTDWAVREFDEMQKEAPNFPQSVTTEYLKKHKEDRNKPDIVSDDFTIHVHKEDTT